MINYRDLHRFAGELLLPSTVDETKVRRAISSLYYGLFHRLTTEGAAVFAAGGQALTDHAARAFSHLAMRRVCDIYARAQRQPFPAPLDRLAQRPPDPRLVKVASIFADLQGARHAADYDLTIAFIHQDGRDWLAEAELAHAHLDEIKNAPETRVFLTALLLAERWTRRG